LAFENDAALSFEGIEGIALVEEDGNLAMLELACMPPQPTPAVAVDAMDIDGVMGWKVASRRR